MAVKPFFRMPLPSSIFGIFITPWKIQRFSNPFKSHTDKLHSLWRPPAGVKLAKPRREYGGNRWRGVHRGLYVSLMLCGSIFLTYSDKGFNLKIFRHITLRVIRRLRDPRSNDCCLPEEVQRTVYHVASRSLSLHLESFGFRNPIKTACPEKFLEGSCIGLPNQTRYYPSRIGSSPNSHFLPSTCGSAHRHVRQFKSHSCWRFISHLGDFGSKIVHWCLILIFQLGRNIS